MTWILGRLGAKPASPSVERGDIGPILDEVQAGLPNEYSPRIDEAIINNNFYDMRMKQYIRYREQENVLEHQAKPYRATALTRNIVNVLTKHLYNPGPSRRIANSSTADKWLQRVYQDNYINAKFLEADRLATLNDVACLQVHALGQGDDDDADGEAAAGYAPIGVHVYGSEEFAAWCSPDRPTRPWCVCTITRFNLQRRFQVWTAEDIYTYMTDSLEPTQTSGGRVASFVGKEVNPYGVLPFEFVHYSMPNRQFWTTGIGGHVTRVNMAINQAMTDLANAASIYCCPPTFAYNVKPGWLPIMRPGGIMHVVGDNDPANPDKEPRIDIAQYQLDIAGQWLDISNTIDQCLEDAEVPRSSVRMEQTTAASGDAIAAEQVPLLTRAKSRRNMFVCYESNLAKLCLLLAGNYYGVDEFIEAAADLQLQATWPEPDSPIPGPEKDQGDEWEVANDYSSEIKVLMRRHGYTRQQAVSELEQIYKDKKEAMDLKKKYGIDQESYFGGANGQPTNGEAAGAGLDGAP